MYRTTGDFITNNRSNRNGDVYYYSPNNRKFRSLREIQEQLNLSLDDNFLTIDSFTFLKQPIGINDRSKEIIRDANTKLPKVIFEIILCVNISYKNVLFENKYIIQIHILEF